MMNFTFKFTSYSPARAEAPGAGWKRRAPCAPSTSLFFSEGLESHSAGPIQPARASLSSIPFARDDDIIGLEQP